MPCMHLLVCKNLGFSLILSRTRSAFGLARNKHQFQQVCSNEVVSQAAVTIQQFVLVFFDACCLV